MFPPDESSDEGKKEFSFRILSRLNEILVKRYMHKTILLHIITTKIIQLWCSWKSWNKTFWNEIALLKSINGWMFWKIKRVYQDPSPFDSHIHLRHSLEHLNKRFNNNPCKGFYAWSLLPEQESTQQQQEALRVWCTRSSLLQAFSPSCAWRLQRPEWFQGDMVERQSRNFWHPMSLIYIYIYI